MNVLIKSFLVNLFLTILKFIGSVMSNSKTLLADSIHCMSDMSTDLISIIGTKISSKKPDLNHPYGHGKIEYLTSIIMSFFIISLGISILLNSFNGETLVPNMYAIVVLLITIVLKYILSSYLFIKGKLLNSNIIKTNAIESRYDTYNSILALIFIIITIIGSDNNILKYFDKVGSVVMSLLTIKVGIEVLLKNTSSILGEVEEDKSILKNVENIIKSKDYKVRRLSLLKYGSYYDATIDLLLDKNITLENLYIIEKKIKRDLKRSDMSIRYVTVNFKPKNK
jgi:cation diffusion facilitator family transporter